MRETDLRPVLLVKAIEDADGDASLLPLADRAAASRDAKRERPPRGALRMDAGRLPREAEGLLAARAQRLLAQLRVRHPFVQDVVSFAPGTWIAAASCVVAFALGVALSALDGTRRINVLAFPLWGIVAWNLLVYAAVAVSWVRALGAKRRARRWLPDWIAQASMRRVAAIVARARRFHVPLAHALSRFAADWQEAARPVLAARAAAIFHIAAALLGAGLIAGFYVRGVALDYRAGWESTFLEADAARSALRVLYGPASALTGIAVPDAAHLQAIRWREGGGGGESAAPWIHLLAATTLIFVVVPRLLLALLASLSAAHASRTVRLPSAFASYFDRAFGETGVTLEGGGLRVIPYAYEPTAESVARLRASEAAAEARATVPYGHEGEIMAAVRDGVTPARVALLFTAAATPEEESHGRAIDVAREAARASGALLEAIVDEGPYAARMGEELASRVEERRRAWTRLAAAHGIEARFVDLFAMTAGRTVELSLVSHTNVGKTTLVRTLLRRDIGEVADRPHVTDEAAGHVLIETPEGDALRLWDTPGFGDSARLLARLESAGNPLGWLHSQVWDRFTDRAFFNSQQAVRHVKEASDVVLYLVNAAEDPRAAAYVPAEMRILGWIGKPVVVLLNQTGPARGRERDALDESAWSSHLAANVGAHRVMAFDAFARCWVQEDVLLASVERVIAPEKKESFARLRAAWRKRNLEVFDESMRLLAVQLAHAATDREAMPEGGGGVGGLARETRRLIATLAGNTPQEDRAADAAMSELATRLDRGVRESTDRLIAMHGLSGRATDRILSRLATQFDVARRADVNASGMLGGMVTGALGGLAADLSAGGLTLGAGMLLGGVLGALGGGGAAQAYNLMQGADAGRVRWSPSFLAQRPAAALLRYLAVAHYGRGRGDWVESEYPPHWRTLVESIVEKRRERFEAAWAAAAQGADASSLERELQPLVAECARTALQALYPEAVGLFA